MKITPILSSIIFFLLGASIVVIEILQELQDTGWIKGELTMSVILNILFVLLLSTFLYKYLSGKDKILKYIMSAAIFASLAFYNYVSLSYDPAFPTLAGLNAIAVLYLIPGLLLVRGSVALFGKMKTKFIIQGGFPREGKQESDAFFSEILSTAPQNTKVLLVLFAKELDRVEKNTKEDIENFNKNSGGKNLSFDVADENRFIEQIQASDVIYFHGGHTGKLLDTLKTLPDFRDVIKGKIVAGDSAGANILCAAFYSERIGAGEGLCIIPVKVLCHYKEENKDKLKDIKPELETIILHELQFKVFYL